MTTTPTTPSIFDLLEPLGKQLLANGGPDIRGYYARATGGVDIDGLVEILSCPHVESGEQETPLSSMPEIGSGDE